MNIDETTLIFFSSAPFSAGPQKPQTLTPSKMMYENATLKLHDPKKLQFSKFYFEQ